MGLIDAAITLEQEAEANYREAARETEDVGARAVLNMLADEEARHAAALRTTDTSAELSDPDLLEDAKAWVQGAVEGGASSISSDADLLDVFRRAMDVERTTERFYRQHAKDAQEKRLIDLFETLADVEEGHFLFVSSLVEYFNRPSEWVEDAEFGLRPPY